MLFVEFMKDVTTSPGHEHACIVCVKKMDLCVVDQ